MTLPETHHSTWACWLLRAGFVLTLAFATSGCLRSASVSQVAVEDDEPEELPFAEQVRAVRDGQRDVIAVEKQPAFDADLASLADLKNLLILTLDDTRITDAGVQYLRGLENLEHLRLRGAEITDSGLQPLLSLEYLTILNLPQAQFTDAGLASLKNLPNLEQLRFSSPHVTDAGMVELADFPSLWHLHVINVPITDRGLLPLERMPRLLSFYLDGALVTDDGLRRLIQQRQQHGLQPLHLHIDQRHPDFDPMKGTHED